MTAFVLALEEAPLATPIYWSTATIRNEHTVLAHRHRARPEGTETFHEHDLWWPLGPVGRRAAREWTT